MLDSLFMVHYSLCKWHYNTIKGNNMDNMNSKKKKITSNPQGSNPLMQKYKDDYTDNHSTPIVNKAILSAHIKISVRLPRGIVTSLTIKKNIIAIWLLYRDPQITDTEQIIAMLEEDKAIRDDTILTMVNDFVYKCMSDWNKDTGKGLSDFVTELMIEDALETEDHELYTQLMVLIKG